MGARLDAIGEIGGILDAGCEKSGKANDARQGVSTEVFLEATTAEAAKLGKVCRATRSEVRMR